MADNSDDLLDRLQGEHPDEADDALVEQAGGGAFATLISGLGCVLSLGGFFGTIALMLWGIWWFATHPVPGGDALRWAVVGGAVVGSVFLVVVLPSRLVGTLLHGLVAWAKARLHIGTVSEGGSSFAIPSMTQPRPVPVLKPQTGPVGTRIDDDADGSG